VDLGHLLCNEGSVNCGHSQRDSQRAQNFIQWPEMTLFKWDHSSLVQWRSSSSQKHLQMPKACGHHILGIWHQPDLFLENNCLTAVLHPNHTILGEQSNTEYLLVVCPQIHYIDQFQLWHMTFEYWLILFTRGLFYFGFFPTRWKLSTGLCWLLVWDWLRKHTFTTREQYGYVMTIWEVISFRDWTEQS
jgi:hypothetical protein